MKAKVPWILLVFLGLWSSPSRADEMIYCPCLIRARVAAADLLGVRL